ncbi:MAG: hypothetical protein RL226_928 [Bacteroidota bacterium]
MKQLSRAVFVATVVLPLLATTGIAFVYATGYFSPGEKAIVTTLFDERFLRSLLYTLILAFAVVVASCLVALWISSRIPFSKTIPAWMLIPFAIPPVAAAFFTFQLFSGSGLASRLSYHAGWVSDSIHFLPLVNDALGVGVFSAHFMLCMPFLLVYFIYLKNSDEIYALGETARSLGARKAQVWNTITRPLLLRRSVPLLLLFFLFVLGTYEIPLLLGSQSRRAVVPFIVDQIKGYSLAGIPRGYAQALLYGGLIAIFTLIMIKRPLRA